MLGGVDINTPIYGPKDCSKIIENQKKAILIMQSNHNKENRKIAILGKNSTLDARFHSSRKL